jgi:SOS-response transcriptional repressor LexA
LRKGARPELLPFAERLTAAIKQAGGKAVVSKATAVPLQTLDRWMSAVSDASTHEIAPVARHCGVSVDYLVFGTAPGKMTPGTSKSSDLVLIPRFDVRAAAGPGRVAAPSDLEAEAMIGFRESWLRSLGVSPRNAEFIVAEGDSMEDTIKDGDLLLVDTRIDRVTHDHIYIVVNQGFVLVKRLQLLLDGSMRVISDNPRYPVEVIPAHDLAQVHVRGRVRWYGRAI